MIRIVRVALIVSTIAMLGACATKPPTVAQGLELYDNGEYAKAFEVLNNLAQQSNAQAQQALGVMYENGQGVKKDENLALILYRQAASNNNESAQYLLGTMMERKTGLTGNQSEAIKWYRLAATNGHPSAQYRMGQLELNGMPGAAPDLLKASHWFGLAATQGDPQAQLQYGLLLMQGRAGPATEFWVICGLKSLKAWVITPRSRLHCKPQNRFRPVRCSVQKEWRLSASSKIINPVAV